MGKANNARRKATQGCLLPERLQEIEVEPVAVRDVFLTDVSEIGGRASALQPDQASWSTGDHSSILGIAAETALTCRPCESGLSTCSTGAQTWFMSSSASSSWQYTIWVYISLDTVV
jgi:hypothetical protein